MASKKPAKKNITNSQVKTPQLPGKAVKYLAPKGAEAFVCPVCSSRRFKGIIFEHNSKMFCSRNCIPKETSNV